MIQIRCKECDEELETDIKQRKIKCPECGEKQQIEGKEDRCIYKIW